MELLLIPVTLTLGVVLIFFGVHGLPSDLQLSRSGIPGLIHIHPQGQAAGKPVLRSAFPGFQPQQTLRENDLLLADLMTEMIAIRAEMAELRDKFEAAIVAPSAPTPRARRTAKAS